MLHISLLHQLSLIEKHFKVNWRLCPILKSECVVSPFSCKLLGSLQRFYQFWAWRGKTQTFEIPARTLRQTTRRLSLAANPAQRLFAACLPFLHPALSELQLLSLAGSKRHGRERMALRRMRALVLLLVSQLVSRYLGILVIGGSWILKIVLVLKQLQLFKTSFSYDWKETSL